MGYSMGLSPLYENGCVNFPKWSVAGGLTPILGAQKGPVHSCRENSVTPGTVKFWAPKSVLNPVLETTLWGPINDRTRCC